VAKRKKPRDKLRNAAIARQRQAFRAWKENQKRKQEAELRQKQEKERLLRLHQLRGRREPRPAQPSAPATINKVLNGVAASMGVVFRRSYRPIEGWSATHVKSGTTVTAGTRRRAWDNLIEQFQSRGVALKPLPEWEMKHGGGAITARGPEGATARSLRRNKTVVGRVYRRRRK
jgi:hypothetical protein